MVRALCCAGCLVVSAAHAAEPKVVVLVPRAASDLKPLPATDPAAAESNAAPAPSDGLATKWWFWTLIGVAATGAVAGLAFVVGAPQPRGTTLGDGDLRQGKP